MGAANKKWSLKEYEYLDSRDWDMFRTRLKIHEHDVDKLLQVFRKIDIDGGGSIDQIEFFLFFKYPFVTPMAERLFLNFANASKEITFKNFVTVVWTIACATNDALTGFLFEMYDDDNNGTLDAQELLELLEESFGPPELAEWFQILNDCAKGLIKKHTRMGKEELNTKAFKRMVAKHPPLTKYLPLYILRSDFRKYTLGEPFFAKQRPITRVPVDFVAQTFKMSQGELGRMRFLEKNKDREAQAAAKRAREKAMRSTEGIARLKKEDYSIVRTKARIRQKSKISPKDIMRRSLERFDREKHTVHRRRKNHRVAEPRSNRAKVDSETSVTSFRQKHKLSPMQIMDRSRERFERRP